MKANITGNRYLCTDEVEAATRGAVMLAVVGASVYEGPWAAQAAIGAPEAAERRSRVRELYEGRYRVFVGLYRPSGLWRPTGSLPVANVRGVARRDPTLGETNERRPRAGTQARLRPETSP